MQYRPLGRTGLKISRLSFGAGQLRPLKREDAIALLSKVLDAGINYIDIDKQNDESLVAEAIKRTGKKIILSGKSFARTEEEMKADIQGSLETYKTDRLDIYFIHAVIDSADLKRRMAGPLRVLRETRDAGRLGFIGITSNRIEVLEEAVATKQFDVICAPYNLTHRLAEDLLQKACKEGIGVITFQTFGSGSIIRPGNKGPLSYQYPLRFSLTRVNIHSVLIGTNKEKHLNELVAYAEDILSKGKGMSDKESGEASQRITSLLGEKFCRGCRYCIRDYDSHKLEIDHILWLKQLALRLGQLQYATERYRGLAIVDPQATFSNAWDENWPCPHGIDIERELHEAHKMFMDTQDKPGLTKRRLGRTGLKVSLVSFGGGAFNKDISPGRLWQVVSDGLDRGVNLLETAQEYGEENFSLAIRKARESGRPLIICSKSVASTYDDMKLAVAQSLEKLGTSHIHIYQLQTIMSPEDFERRVENGSLRALQEAREEGKIDAIGVSSHRVPALLAAITSGKIDVVEVPYSIGQSASAKVLRAARKFDVGVMAIMTLGGGILVDRDNKSPHARQMTAGNALRFVLADPQVHTALVGMGSKEHVEENTSAVTEQPLPSWLERRFIEKKALSILGKDFCRSCKACMPCEVYGWAFSIDNFFRFHTFSKVYGYPQYSEEYQRLPILADACTGCGLCEERCPYNIQIAKRLKDVHKNLGGKKETNLSELSEHVTQSVEEYLTREVEPYRRERRFKEGIEFMNMQMRFFPENPVLLRNIGECHMEMGDYDKAIRYFQKVCSLRKRTDWLHFSLGKSHFKKGEYIKAIGCFKDDLRYSHTEESHFHSRYFMAICYQKLRQYGKMKECFNRVKNFDRLFGRREIFEEEQLKQFVQQWPASLWQQEFQHFREGAEYKEGIRFGRLQLKGHPDSAVLHHYLGEFHMELEEYPKAIFHLSKAVKLEPKREWTHFSLGKCYYLINKYGEAESALNKNLALTSDRLSHYHSWIFLAMAADAMKDTKGYQKALGSLKGFKDCIGKEIPLEQCFFARLEQAGRLPQWLRMNSSCP